MHTYMQTEIHTYIPTFICFPPGQQRGVSPASFAADRHPQPLAWDQTFTGSPFPGSNYIYIYILCRYTSTNTYQSPPGQQRLENMRHRATSA